MLLQQRPEHLGVFRRMPYQKHRAEARTECRLRLRYAALGSSELCGVSGKEIVHRLLRSEPRNWWQNAESICSEKYDILRMPTATVSYEVRDVVERIRRSGIFGDRQVVEANLLG